MTDHHQPGCGCRDINHLVEGVKTFKSTNYGQELDMMRKLVEEGQSPATLIISCSDSRVDPALLTGAKPGELFTVRNVANLVPPYAPGASLHGTGAAIEYAVRDLKVDHIVVLGHAHCGGIKALIAGAAGNRMERDFINDWMDIALDATELKVNDPTAESGRRTVTLEWLQHNTFLVERSAIMNSIRNLMSYPWLRDRVETGTLQLHGWWFDLETGDLWKTQPGGDQLMPVL
ncbi:carbonic anhydrase [Aquamicrobium zhengzhouense]|uniref:Carbonic anhydrase n=1 Tax=Aquamicrobium zhengzhouense TaxID=2781738 RepID=A0ABS0SEQ5_9HYPH|nr:carbonic anhydrase [Aquamicrobium zhengzhouense]MBI1621779.1 carbonic anhydrase [Aquamicrobium zhengzhouense]